MDRGNGGDTEKGRASAIFPDNTHLQANAIQNAIKKGNSFSKRKGRN
jgi:hypothetical protein